MRRIDQLRARKNRRRVSPHSSIQKLETLGIIMVVMLILAITLTRSWHHINWSAR